MNGTARKNDEYVDLFAEEFKKDKFYNKPDLEQILLVYYNNDSNAGGQLVYNYIQYDHIRKADTTNAENFFRNLEEICYQEVVDIDDKDFAQFAREFAESGCDYVNSDEVTMKALLEIVNGRNLPHIL